MKSAFFSIVALLISLNSSLGFAAAQSDASFVASSVIVKAVLAENLLQTSKYDALMAAALERDNGTSISDLVNCEISTGTYACALTVTGKGASVSMEVYIQNGKVSFAEAK